MKTIFGIGKITKPLKKSVVTIGVFDGVHQGHQYLIKEAVKKAKQKKATSVVITFWPHPAVALNQSKNFSYLCTLEDRLKYIESLGVDVCLVVRFNKRFSSQSPQTFVKRYLVNALKAESVFVGNDFRFGQDRAGDTQMFHDLGLKYGFTFNGLKKVKGKGVDISSTRLRQLITDGKLKQANKLLGRSVSVTGKVVKGDGRGKTLGYPTANIQLESNLVLPQGVFAVKVALGRSKGYRHSALDAESHRIPDQVRDDNKIQVYLAMANVGVRPTFKRLQGRRVTPSQSLSQSPSQCLTLTPSQTLSPLLEVHLFNFKGFLYGKSITIEFIQKIRSEKIFSNSTQLIAQLQKDEQKARKILKIK